MSQHLRLLCLQTSILHEAFIRTLGDRLSEAKYVVAVGHFRLLPDKNSPFYKEKT